MIQKVFGIRDCKTLAFLQPFFSPQVGSAIRAFDDEVNKESSPFHKHPADYNLYELADFDDQSGEFIACVPIKLLGVGSDFLRLGESHPTSAVSSNIRLAEAVKGVENGAEKVG